MKRLLAVLLVAVLAAASQADVLVYESFGDCTDGQAFTGYSGTYGTTEIGLSGTWSADDSEVQLKERGETFTGIAAGYSVDEDSSGNKHWAEHWDSWNATACTRSLSSSIDLTTDGTYYMSFFTRMGGNDVIAQLGLSNATHELMWGQGYNRGLTAYYGSLGTAADTNNNQTNISIANWWDAIFWVAKLEKTDSGGTNTLNVSINYYDLREDNVVEGEAPTVWARTVTLTGVNTSFDTLRFKLDGGGNQWPGMDELRLGETWSDVTGVPPIPNEDPMTGYVGDMTDSLVNSSFELPGQGKIKGWDGEGVGGSPAVDVPGWTSLTTPADSGVEDSNPYVGDYRAFLMDTDDPVYQITDVNIVANQPYTLEVHMLDAGSGEPNGFIGLYYLSNPADPNTVVFLGDGPVVDEELTGSYKALSTSFTASSAGPEVGQKLQIMIGSHDFPNGAGWIAFDEVKLCEYVVHGVLDQAPDGADVDPLTLSQLSWTPTNDPNVDGVGSQDQVLYYYIGDGNGSDPDYDAYLTASGISTGIAATSYPISMTYDQYCLWRVDTVLDGVTYTGKTILFTTLTQDMAPEIQQWDWVRTWPGQSTTLYADVNDFGENDLDIYDWTVTVGDPNLIITGTDSSNKLHPEATVAANAPGFYEVTLVVTDSADGSLGAQPSNTATYHVDVYANACEAAAADGGYNYYDRNNDCKVGIIDFADFALYWLDDITLQEPEYY